MQLLGDIYYRSLLGKSWLNKKWIGFYVFVGQNKPWNTRLGVIEKETLTPRVFFFVHTMFWLGSLLIILPQCRV